MRFIDIEALTLEDTLSDMLPDLDYVLANLVNDDRLTENENFYNRITMDDKPELSFFLNTLTSYKSSLRSARSDELFNSIDINKLSSYLYSLGVIYSEYELFIRGKADQDDQEFFDLLYIKESEYDVFRRDADAINYGKQLRRICNEALELITGINATEKNLTRDEIDVMQFTYADIQKALESLRPDTALYLLSIAEPDGSIVAVEDIQRLSNYIFNEVSKLR